MGNSIVPSKYWEVSAAVQDGETLPLTYLTSEAGFLLPLPVNSFDKTIQVQLAYTAGTYTGIMNIYFKAADANGNGACHTCAITNMTYTPGNFLLDLPYQEASWDLIEEYTLKLDGNEIILKDISILQNWNEPNLK
ncbi:MAG: hypothetical protein ACK4IY_04605 [Chitinophagales bacterium]